MDKKYSSHPKFKNLLRNILSETHFKLGKYIECKIYRPKFIHIAPDDTTFNALKGIKGLENHSLLPRLLLSTNPTLKNHIKLWRNDVVKSANGGKALSVVTLMGCSIKLPVVDDRISDHYYIEAGTLEIRPVALTEASNLLTIVPDAREFSLSPSTVSEDFWPIARLYLKQSNELRAKLPGYIKTLKDNKSNYSVSPPFILHSLYKDNLLDFDRYGFFNSYFIAQEIQTVLTNMYRDTSNSELIIPVAPFHIASRYHYLEEILRRPKSIFKYKHVALKICIMSKTVNVIKSVNVDLGSITKQAMNMQRSYNKARARKS